MEKKKNYIHIFWIAFIILCGLCLFLFTYHSPIKLNDEVKNEIITELNKDTLNGSVIDSTLSLSNNVGALITESKNSKTNEQTQGFNVLVVKDSSVKECNGWLILDKKFLGYKILEIRVNK